MNHSPEFQKHFSVLDEKSFLMLNGLTKPNSNCTSVLEGLKALGKIAGLNLPHRLVPFLAQIGHESNSFQYDREIWGPTKAQLRYEGRKDLGNTQPGDGKKFAGRTAMQITGRHNTREFRDWLRTFMTDVPDFEQNPDLMNTDPWEGLGPVWYWSTRNLNVHADRGDFKQITKRINGGYNGLADRERRYTQLALRMLGYRAKDIRGFQRDAGLVVDGDAGPKTRMALHKHLQTLSPVMFGVPSISEASVGEQKMSPSTALFLALLGLGAAGLGWVINLL